MLVLVASSPPGSSFAASLKTSFSPFQTASATFFASKPERKPSINDFPMLMPSSTALPGSRPSRPRIPSFRAVPSPCPISFALPVSHVLPLPLHHLSNGSATSLSQATCTFSQSVSAFFHSELLVSDVTLFITLSILFPMASAMFSAAACTPGIFPVSQSTKSLTYGLNRSPTAIFTPSTALCRYVNEPDRLSFMVRAISAEAPSQFTIASVTFSMSFGVEFISASHPDIASCPAITFP